MTPRTLACFALTSLLALGCGSETLTQSEPDVSLGSEAELSTVGFSGQLFASHWAMSGTATPTHPVRWNPFPTGAISNLRLWGIDSVQWGPLEPARGSYDFANLDAVVDA